MRSHSVRRWIHRQRIVVDAHDRVERIDQRYGIRTTVFRGLGRRHDTGNIRRQFYDDWHRSRFFRPFSGHLNVLGHLTNRRAHSPFGHAVRTAEIQFKSVDPRGFDHRQVLRPGFLIHWQHDGCDHCAIRPVFFDLAEFIEVGLQRPVGYQLDIIETDDAFVIAVKGAVTRAADVHDVRVLAERLPDGTAPARFECAIHVVGLVRWWR